LTAARADVSLRSPACYDGLEMPDAGVVLEVRRVDGAALSRDDHARIEAVVDELRRQELVDELGSEAEWNADPSPPDVARFIVFKLWGDDIELHVLEPDGSIRPPMYETHLIEGEEVDVPGAPPEGNPDADEMLALLLDRNRSRLIRALTRVEAPAELRTAALAEHW
jgi:hypothetical protein